MNAVVLGIDTPVEIDRKEKLRDHRLYWIGRRTQDVILSSGALVLLSPVMLATAMKYIVPWICFFSHHCLRGCQSLLLKRKQLDYHVCCLIGCRMCGAAVPQAPVLTAPASSAGSSITAAMGGVLDVQQPTACAESAAMFLLRMHSPAT